MSICECNASTHQNDHFVLLVTDSKCLLFSPQCRDFDLCMNVNFLHHSVGPLVCTCQRLDELREHHAHKVHDDVTSIVLKDPEPRRTRKIDGQRFGLAVLDGLLYEDRSSVTKELRGRGICRNRRSVTPASCENDCNGLHAVRRLIVDA
jgi:hypothetical protein